MSICCKLDRDCHKVDLDLDDEVDPSTLSSTAT
jgi:hypothetical protein